MVNQNPEQIARDNIDKQLSVCGWIIQDKTKINLNAGIGVAVREYLTDVGPADYLLFVDGKPVGVVEAKRETEGSKLTVHEDQAESYAGAKLNHLNNVINNWMRSKDTILFSGLWEQLNNPDFKPTEFDRFKNEAGANKNEQIKRSIGGVG